MHNDLRIQRECLALIFDCGWSSKEVAEYKKINDSTIRNWKAHFQLFGRSPAVSRRERKKLGPRIENRKFTTAVKHALKTIVIEKPWMYLDEFQTELFDRTNVRVSISALYKVLTNEMKWSVQRAEVAAKERNEVDRAEHHATLATITDNPLQFVFVDETSKDNNVTLRRRLWRPVNQRAPISRYFSDHARHCYTMIGACDMNGFIIEACDLVRRKRNNADPDEEAGTVDSERFVQWVHDRLVPTLGNYYLGEPRSIVVMDNAAIHNDNRVFTLITDAGALLLYQAAYSPDLDPIEFAFHQYKSDLRRHGRDFGGDSYAAHLHALNSVTSNNMAAYYRMVGGIRNVPSEVDKDTGLKDEAELQACMLAAATVVQNNSAAVATSFL